VVKVSKNSLPIPVQIEDRVVRGIKHNLPEVAGPALIQLFPATGEYPVDVVSVNRKGDPWVCRANFVFATKNAYYFEENLLPKTFPSRTTSYSRRSPSSAARGTNPVRGEVWVADNRQIKTSLTGWFRTTPPCRVKVIRPDPGITHEAINDEKRNLCKK